MKKPGILFGNEGVIGPSLSKDLAVAAHALGMQVGVTIAFQNLRIAFALRVR